MTERATKRAKSSRQGRPKPTDTVGNVRLELVVLIDRESCRLIWTEGKERVEKAFSLEAIVAQWWSQKPFGAWSSFTQSALLQGEWIPDATGLITDAETVFVTDAIRDVLSHLFNGEGTPLIRHSAKMRIEGRRLSAPTSTQPPKDIGSEKGVFEERLADSAKLGQHLLLETETKESSLSSSLELSQARAEFERAVDAAARERERQVATIQERLSAYLNRWDEEQQRLTRENKLRSADEICQAKKDLVHQLNAALDRLNISISRNGRACNLFVYSGNSNRRGVFWLAWKGASKPVATKANLGDIFNFAQGEPSLESTGPRREALSQWHEREKTRRQKPKSPEME